MNVLISPAEAEACIAAALVPMASEEVPAHEAVGRVLAKALVADRPLPPFDRVMMDGIACRAADAKTSGGQLAIAGLHPAGAPPPGPLAPGSCWEIMTGSCLPPDCDTVIPVEEITSDSARVSFPLDAVDPGKFIHPTGSDFPAGAELVPAGTKLGSRELAVAATVGATQLCVSKLPRVTIVTTGDELVRPDRTPLAHQVRQSNGPALQAALERCGLRKVPHLHLPDEKSALSESLAALLPTTDVLIVCGGISRGKRDYVRPVLEDLLGKPAFHGVSQRPGKPLAFWSDSPLAFALPGNPMSVLICFHRYVAPALSLLVGRREERLHYPLASAVDFAPSLNYFIPALVTKDLHAQPQPLANSGDFASAISSTGFLELPADPSHFPEGTMAPYTPWL